MRNDTRQFWAQMIAGTALLVGMVGCSGSSTSGGGGGATPQAPTAKVGGPYSGTAGVAVNFSGNGSIDPQSQALTYAWNFGDSSTGTGVSTTHAYAAAGTYAVSLTVTDTSNLSSAASTTTATIAPAPSFTLSANPQSVALTAGSSEVVDLLVTAQNGFAGTVTATLSGLPSGVTANASSYTLTPGVVTQATLTASSGVGNTIASMTVSGVSGTLTGASQVVLTTGTQADYYLALSGPGVSLTTGSSQSFYVTAYPENGFTGTVNWSMTGLPAGVTMSASTTTLPLGTGILVTLTAGSGIVAGSTAATLTSNSGTTTHSLPVLVNVGTLAQDFVVATPVALNIAANGTTTFDLSTDGVNGFAGIISVAISGLPTGVTANQTSFTVSLQTGGISSASTTLTGASGLTSGTTSFTVTATSGSLVHTNTIVLTKVPSTTETATVATTSPGTAFPSFFVGLSMPYTTLSEFTGTGTATWPSFINMLGNLKTYVGSPSLRVSSSSVIGTETPIQNYMAALETAATFTVNGVTTAPQFFVTTSSSFNPANDASEAQGLLNAVGSANVLGFELDNEPDLYVSNGYRPAGWSYTDYLNETASYLAAMGPVVTEPKFVVTAASSRYWDVGLPTIMQQMSGQVAAYTQHDYALTACSNTPTIAQLMADQAAHNYYSRYAGLVKTWGSVPVRVGEMNSVSCQGFAGVSNTFAASLWLVDTAFEAKSAGTVGFNLHSNGTESGGADPYDIGFNNSTGSLNVYAPFYGILFFAEAIQNGAKPLPVTITQSTGNMKVWATMDAANTVRVVVLEKDTDGIANTKTVALNLGSYSKVGTLMSMSAPSLGSTSGIAIAGQTFDGTTNGVLTGTTTSTQVTGSGGIYTITVADGTAAMLTVAQ